MLAHLLRDLAPFTPTLVGTFPLGLQVDGSDLDILCSCADLDSFQRALTASLAAIGVAADRIERIAEPAALVAVVTAHDPLIEIYCQPQPVYDQRGFRHFAIEARLLAIGGAGLADRLRVLRRSGVKTEPAFAQLLGLDGDPYEALLALEDWPAERLRSLLGR